LRARLLGVFARLGRLARKLKSLATMAKDRMPELKRLKRFWPDSVRHWQTQPDGAARWFRSHTPMPLS